jgi:hypothetical protein
MLGLASPAVAQEEAKAPVEAPPSTPPPAKLGTTDDALKLARGLGEQHADQSDLRRIRKDYDRDRAAIKQAFDAHLASDFEPVPPTYELRGLSQKLTVFVSEVAGWRSELGERQRGLTRSRRELLDLTKQWQERLALEQQTDSPEALIERINNVLDAIKTSDGVVQSGLQEVLALDNELLAHEDELANLVKRLDEMLSNVRQGFIRSDAPPIWEMMSGDALMLGLHSDLITKERFDDETKSFWRIYERTFWFHLAFLGAMLVSMLALRRSDYVRKQEDLQVSFRVLERPVSGAVLVYVFLLPLLYDNAPILVLTMFRVLSLIPVVRLIPVFVTKPFRPTFYTIAALFALETVYDVLPDESGVSRLLLLLMTGVGLWGATSGARSLFAIESVQALPRLGFIRRLVNFLALLLALAVLTNVIGAAGFAGFLTEALLGSAYVALGLFVGNAVLADFIRLLLGSRAFRKVRAVTLNRQLIFKRVTRATRWVVVTAWVFLTLTAFELVPGLLGFVANLLKASVTIGSMELSVGGVGLFILAIYLAVLVLNLCSLCGCRPRHIDRGISLGSRSQ